MNGNKGFTLVELAISVAIIGVLAAIAIPALFNARQKANAETCRANRSTLERAEQLFIADHQRHTDTIAELNAAGYYDYVTCPKGGTFFWVEFEEGSDQYQSLMGCSVHGVYTTVEQNDQLFAELVYEDDFTGDLSNWSTIYGRWQVRDGRLESRNNGYHMILSDDGTYGDQSIRTTVKFDHRNASAAIVFRAETSGRRIRNGYGLELDRRRKSFVYTRIENGRFYEEVFKDVPDNFDWDAEHEMEVKAVGDKLTLYVNGDEALTVNDDSFSEGQVGLYAAKRLSFDDIEVRESEE